MYFSLSIIAIWESYQVNHLHWTKQNVMGKLRKVEDIPRRCKLINVCQYRKIKTWPKKKQMWDKEKQNRKLVMWATGTPPKTRCFGRWHSFCAMCGIYWGSQRKSHSRGKKDGKTQRQYRQILAHLWDGHSLY